MEAQRAAAARQKELERASASAEAARKWEAATAPRPGHPYLKKKGKRAGEVKNGVPSFPIIFCMKEVNAAS